MISMSIAANNYRRMLCTQRLIMLSSSSSAHCFTPAEIQQQRLISTPTSCYIAILYLVIILNTTFSLPPHYSPPVALLPEFPKFWLMVLHPPEPTHNPPTHSHCNVGRLHYNILITPFIFIIAELVMSNCKLEPNNGTVLEEKKHSEDN